MTSKYPNQVTVYIFLPGEGHVPAGLLHQSATQISFQYGRRYIQRPNAIPVDPVRLPLIETGKILAPRGQPMLNALRDAAPEKWGRKVLGLIAGQDASLISEFEILAAFHSKHRIGGLAFGPTPESGPQSMASWAPTQDPFVKSYDELERISKVIATVEALDEDELDKLREHLSDAFLHAFTSIYSIGGARPKCLLELDAVPWIAKFSKADDKWNEPRVEHAIMTLARACGITTAETKLLEVSGKDVLLVKRFDRTKNGDPRHFISALTLTDRQEDGDWGSYQDLAEASRHYGDSQAGKQLFRRMVFNVLAGNTDDHLRNQAWFVGRNTIELTPAFDIISQWLPNRGRQALRCGIKGNEASIENVLSQPEPFGLAKVEATLYVETMLKQWGRRKEIFGSCGLSERDIKHIENRILQV